MSAHRPPLPRRLLYALAPLLLVLVGVEALARLAWAPPSAAALGTQLPPHPTRLWTLPPGAHLGPGPDDARVDANGLRRVSVQGAPHRALTLGDSNVFGHGLPDRDTLHAALGRALAAEGVAVDVLCGGVPGYSSAQSLVLLDEVGWGLEPDLLIVANLLSDSTEERFQDAELLEQVARPGARARRHLLDHSRALTWLTLRLHPPSRTEQNVGWLRPPGAVHRPRVPVADYEQNLRRMASEAAARGVAVAFLELATVPAWRGEPDGEAWRRAQRRVAAEVGAPHVDGLAALRAAGLSEDAAFIDEVHVSAAGNQAYAAALARALRGAGWP